MAQTPTISELKMGHRISGHETFACRYAWLPKAAQEVDADSTILTAAKEDDAMVRLGVGKNMVRSIRFWAESANFIQSTKVGHEVTEFGRDLLLGDGAFDPHLEDVQTLWLIHWKLATNQQSLIFAWDFLLNNFHEPELHASAVVRAFSKTLVQISNKEISRGSLEQLYDVFLHSYVPTRGRKGEVREDNLDCPLVELDLLRHTGLTKSALHPGRVEAKYSFRREEKAEISLSLFAYCLHEYWDARYPQEQSIPFHSVVVGHGSPGQIFKIPEADIRSRLLGIDETTDGYFVFEESAAIPRIVRQQKHAQPSLAKVYCIEATHA